MDRSINFEIMESRQRMAVISTQSKLEDEKDKRIEINKACLFHTMNRLADKYNNHPDGCIGITFTMA